MAVYDNSDAHKHLPLVNFNFMLRVEGVWDLPCKSVHSFTKENEFEPIQEGGLNDYVHLRRKPISKPFTFTVERYAMVDEGAYDPLQQGAELVLPLLLFVTNHAGEFDKTRRVYVFTGCTIMSKEYGELDAEKSGLLIERTTIAYRELATVSWPFDNENNPHPLDSTHSIQDRKKFARTIPSGEKTPNTKHKWNPEDAVKAEPSKSGKNRNWIKDGTKSAREYPGKENAAATQRKWEFDENDYKGKGTRSSRPDVSKPMNKKDIRKWAFDKDDYRGTGIQSAKKEN